MGKKMNFIFWAKIINFPRFFCFSSNLEAYFFRGQISSWQLSDFKIIKFGLRLNGSGSQNKENHFWSRSYDLFSNLPHDFRMLLYVMYIYIYSFIICWKLVNVTNKYIIPTSHVITIWRPEKDLKINRNIEFRDIFLYSGYLNLLIF